MHQLTVLFVGWVAFFHWDPDPALTNIVPQSTFFGCSPSTFFFPLFFPKPDLHTSLPPSYPIDLASFILTYISTQPPTYLLSYLFTHPLSISTFVPTYLSIYLLTYIPTYPRTYLPTYLLPHLTTCLPSHHLHIVNVRQCIIYKIWKYCIEHIITILIIF